MEIKKAIEKVLDAGMRVYVPRNKEHEFMKVYSEGLERMLEKVSGNSFKVFFALVSEMDYENNRVKLTRDQIMLKTGFSKNTVVKAIDELEREGFLERLGSSINRSYQLNQFVVRKGKREKN